MSLYNFLNPADEDLVIDEEPTLEEIIAQHTGEYIEDEEAILEDVEPPLKTIPLETEAIRAVRTLLLYQEHQEQARVEDIRFLERFKRVLSILELS